MTAGGLQSKFWKKTTYAFLPYGLIAFDSLQDIKIIFSTDGGHVWWGMYLNLNLLLSYQSRKYLTLNIPENLT
jgi:hypothetical protein